MKHNKSKFFRIILIFILLIPFHTNYSPIKNSNIGSEMIIAARANTLDLDLNIGLNEDGLVKIKDTDDSGKAWGEFIGNYKNFITGVSAVGAITMVALFIMQFLKLGASAGNPQARREALIGVLWTGIATSLLGGVALFTGIFYRAIN